jgi:glycosyltransferase involved in cell wall biosynthesis
MRVGIFVSEFEETMGGGHTFVREIFDAFLRHKSETSHEFSIIAEAIQSSKEVWQSGLPLINLRRSLICRARDRLLYIVRFWNDRYRRHLPNVAYVDQWQYPILKNNRIEFILGISPQCHHTTSIPYSTLVWDLQHRLQPFFPEVNLNAEWESRERDYARLLQKAAFIIAGTEASKREIQMFYGVDENRIRILPHPTPALASNSTDTEGQGENLEQLGITDEFIFYPAQFWPHKNHIALLLALKYLRDKYGWTPQLVLTGTDKGNLNHVQTRIRELGLNSTVKVIGFVKRSVLIALYQRALALVFPSFFGPENLPPLEAFSLGCPVIAADVPGSEEQLADAAIRVGATDVVAWANAIYSLHSDDRLRSSLIAKGHVRAQRFTAVDFVKNLFHLLDEFEAVRRSWS